jgi:hypothetical protein
MSASEMSMPYRPRRLHIGMRLERRRRELGIIVGHGVAELARREPLLPLVLGGEFLPDDVAPLERGDDEGVHVAHRYAIADVLRHVGEHECGEIDVVLLRLRPTTMMPATPEPIAVFISVACLASSAFAS